MLCESIPQIQFSQISFYRRYSSTQKLLHVTQKSLSAHVLGGGQFAAFYKNIELVAKFD